MKKTFTLFTACILFPAFLQAQNVVINEVDYDQPGNDTAEFIELYNNDAANPVNLSSYVLIFFNGSNNTVYDSIVLPSFLLVKGAFFVVCRSGGASTNCSMYHTAATELIQNGSPDAIAIKHRLTQTIVDALSYEGDCIAPYIEGAGTLTAASDNDINAGISLSRYPDGGDSNNNRVDFHLACSTRGAPNVANTAGCIVLGANEIKQSSRIYVYPNPASGSVSVFGMPASRQWDLSLYDITGRQCMHLTIETENNVVHFNAGEVPSGVYMVEISGNGYTSKQRLVVSRY